MREARRSIWDLRSGVEDLSLPARLQQIEQRISPDSGASFEVQVRGVPRACDPRAEYQILRIAEEAVNNAVQHAHAKHIRVELFYSDESVTLRVGDDGCGFDTPVTFDTNERHWGLKNMQERAALIGGRLTLTSRPGQGTTVETMAVSRLSREGS
jgi:signal transduction histidine kinase